MNFLATLKTLGIFTFALLISTYASAEVYRSVDADGNVTYSDTPHSGAEKIEVREPTIIPSTRSRIKLGSEKQPKQALPYTKIEIVSPSNEETLRNVQSVSVRGLLIPGLQTAYGHRVEILFNGSAIGEPGISLNATLNEVVRGAHTLQLRVVDRQGSEVARSPVSQFFLHKNSVRRAN
ncbi:MAG: DUF4124 domain-containing protein [Gammaproteobacteria bacterium]